MPYDPANSANIAVASLRHTDRKRLLDYLLKLGDADPQRRAQAALDATGLLQRKGLSWATLVPARPAESGDEALPPNWQRQALALSVYPGVDPDECAFLSKLSGWKAPGQAGLARMRAIAERVGIELH